MTTTKHATTDRLGRAQRDEAQRLSLALQEILDDGDESVPTPTIEAARDMLEWAAQVAERLEQYTMLRLHGVDVDQGLRVRLSGELVEHFAIAFAEHFRASGAENYLEMQLTDPKTFDFFAVTIQKVGKLTPHRARVAAENRAARWKLAAKRHRKLHKGYEEASAHFASESREMAALATENAARAEAAERRLAFLEQIMARAPMGVALRWNPHDGIRFGIKSGIPVVFRRQHAARGGTDETLAEALDAAIHDAETPTGAVILDAVVSPRG